MADVEEAEIDYWKRNYGIHLIGYETREMPDGSRSHALLLDLLDLLNGELHAFEETFPFKGGTANAYVKAHGTDKKMPDQSSAEMLFAFMRYAARFQGYVKAETEFGIRIHRVCGDGGDRKNIVVSGLPGIGYRYRGVSG